MNSFACEIGGDPPYQVHHGLGTTEVVVHVYYGTRSVPGWIVVLDGDTVWVQPGMFQWNGSEMAWTDFPANRVVVIG